MSAYDVFALYYDTLTKNVDYAGRADYLLAMLKRLDHCAGIALDLACGTGSLSLELYRRGVDVYGVDSSVSMLSAAKEKAVEAGADILFLCQSMEKLDLFGTVNTVFCCLDSINHLSKRQAIERAFQRVSLFLEPGGWFLFDFNTVYKHRNILADQVFVYDIDPVFCVWSNKLRQGTDRVDISLEFFENQEGLYRRSHEHFSEISFPIDVIEELLKKTGFKNIQVFEDLSFEPPKESSQKVLFAAQK